MLSAKTGLKSVRALGYLLVAKTIILVAWSYREYFPPDFQSDFLVGRSDYFWGTYCWAFYVHIVSGPISLFLGLLLVTPAIRNRYRSIHRIAGRIQVANVAMLVAPSGLVMSPYSRAGATAAFGFAALSLATFGSILLGWRAAVNKKYHQHQIWMVRCWLMLCSAVVLRVVGGISQLLAIDGTYSIAAWASWIVPLAVYEWSRVAKTNADNNRPNSRSYPLTEPQTSFNHDSQHPHHL